MRLLVCLVPCLVSAVQLTEVSVTQFDHLTQVTCAFSERAALQYDPGFKVALGIPRFLKKKYFFCPNGVLGAVDEHLGDDTSWGVYVTAIKKPYPGIVVVCAFDPAIVDFSYTHDLLTHRCVIYFTKRNLSMFSDYTDERYSA